jgi:hypothetical protein
MQRDLAFQGFEADRDALKYRCPAAAYGLDCAGREACSRSGGVEPGDYGRIVRIKLEEQDRRIFTPTPTAAPVGSAATIAAAPWSGSTTGSTTALALSAISSAVTPRCRPVWVWPWRS